MRLRGERLRLGRQRGRINPYRVLIYLSSIATGVVLIWMVKAGKVRPAFMATPTPTRLPISYIQEGEARFEAGDLDRAIEAYRNAAQLDPENAQIWADLARIQAYSSALLTTAGDRRQRLEQAKRSADRAVELAPEDSPVQAIKSFVYDWLASSENPGSSEKDAYLNEAFTAALRAYQLDNQNSLALAYRAEVLLDQQKYEQALNTASNALEQAEAQGLRLFDVYRVYGTVLEGMGQYNAAISAYERARKINPNLTFIHLLIGANYRQLRDIDRALMYFAEAQRINEQNGVMDPTPYLAIAKTYMQQGEFFIAARNIEKALEIDPRSPDIYGRLGIVYYKARNYESAVEVLKCAVDGCAPELSRELLCRYVHGCDLADEGTLQYCVEVKGQELNNNSLEQYYTYGSVLAFYSYCDEAERIFKRLETSYRDDDIVSGIVAEGRAICLRSGSKPDPTPTPEAGIPQCPSS